MLNQLFKYIFSLDDSYFIITLLTKPKKCSFPLFYIYIENQFLSKVLWQEPNRRVGQQTLYWHYQVIKCITAYLADGIKWIISNRQNYIRIEILSLLLSAARRDFETRPARLSPTCSSTSLHFWMPRANFLNPGTLIFTLNFTGTSSSFPC